MYQSFKTPSAQKVEFSSSAGNDASVHLSPFICIKGRNVDVDKFLEFIVAIAQNHQGWIDSGIFFQDVIEFAKINKIPMHTRSKTERTRFMVKHLIQDIQLYFIHVKILERVLGREFDLSPREEKELTSLGIDVNVLRFNGENSQSYQEQMIRVRQKLAFLKLKFHT